MKHNSNSASFLSTISLVLLLTGCGGFSGLSSQIESGSLFSRIHQSDAAQAPGPNGQCAAGSALFGNNCYPIRSADVSSSDAIKFYPNDTIASYVHIFQLNDANIGMIALKGNLTLRSDKKDFSENLVQIGFIPTCDGGGRYLLNDVQFAKKFPQAQFFTSLIIKSQEQGETTLPINYTFNEPVSAAGCLYVMFAGDTIKRDTNTQMINHLNITYVAPSTNVNASKYAWVDANGGEVCVGHSNKNCLAPSRNNADNSTYQNSLRVNQSGVIRQAYGSVSDAPWAPEGISPISGAWSVIDTWFIDRQCATTNPGESGPGTFQTTQVAESDLIVRVRQDMNGPDKTAQQFINQDINKNVSAGDCIVHRRIANSNGTVDMEAQLMMLVESGATIAAPTGQMALSAPVSIPQAAPQQQASRSPASEAAPVAAPQAAPATAPVAAPAPVSPYAGMQTMLIYRFINGAGKHVYSTDGVPPAAGFRLEGPSFSTYVSQAPGMSPLVLCAQGPQRFLSNDGNCEGGTGVRGLGFISGGQVLGASTPLIRYSKNGDWIGSIGTAEGQAAGYDESGLLGFLP